MSFSRESYNYKSLPINRPTNTSTINSSSTSNNIAKLSTNNNNNNTSLNSKTVNFTMPQQQTSQQPVQTQTQIPLSSTTSTSTSTSTTTNNKPSPIINTEEFAKLDALLQDLLAEVDQPILLSKENTKQTNLIKPNLTVNHRTTNNNNKLDEIERSVDWLNEQKEILRTRKELNTNNNNTSNNYNFNTSFNTPPTSKITDPNLTYFNDDLNSISNPHRKIKSKLDFYVSNSTNDSSSAKGAPYANNSLNQTKLGFAYTNSNQKENNFANEIKLNRNQEQTITSTTLNKSINADSLSSHLPIVNNKPPVSPNNRNLYSPTQQQQPQPQATGATSFRSISTNPALLRNINETDDEMNVIDAEFDRFSQKSFKSNGSTIQRSKYHVVSNDFTECTRPAAPTPVPTSNTKSTIQLKRALSAPPTEIGKVVLQRMELKSPLTVRQGSVVPFEQSQAYPNTNDQIIQRVQTPVSYTISSTRNFIDNPYNNRGILKSNNYNGNQISYETSNQQVPTRSVFLNRAYSETPRLGYSNGYETDSGLVTNNNGYVYRNGSNRVYTQMRPNVVDSDVEGYNTNGFRAGEATNYRYGNTGVINNTYRTIGPSTTSRYQVINDQSGYDTDTGLIKLRQVLDNRRSSNNNIPIQNGGYIVQNRSITPSFNYHYNQLTPQQQQQTMRQYNTSQSNIHQIPINDTRYQDQYGNQYGSQYVVNNAYPPNVVENIGVSYIDNDNNFIQAQQINNIEFIDANGNLTSSVPGYVTADGRQVILTDDSNQIGNNLGPQPVIIQQQVVPSGYQQNLSSNTQFNTVPSSNSINIQQQRDTPSRLGITTSASNLSSALQKQQQQQQQQQYTKQDSRRGSENSLNGTDEVLRDHPKSIKATQNYWYKPKISRDEAIGILKDKPPGTFLIRDSNNFPGAYGLALKVDKPPPNVQIKPGADPSNELVRHFLIEPTTKGVRIKGCCNEPVFGSLAALVYQHSITPLALPIKLILPNQDLSVKSSEQSKPTKSASSNNIQDARHLLDKGAACNVYFLNSVNVENKNGLEAITYALNNTKAFTSKDSSQLLLIQFKVTSQGITLSDLSKKKFIRQHFPTNTVFYCAVDEKLTWPHKLDKISKPRIFGVVCKPKVNSGSNECHLFVELDPEQPAIAIVDFINRYLIPSKTLK